MRNSWNGGNLENNGFVFVGDNLNCIDFEKIEIASEYKLMLATDEQVEKINGFIPKTNHYIDGFNSCMFNIHSLTNGHSLQTLISLYLAK